MAKGTLGIAADEDAGEKRSGREPQGPAHDRSGSLGQTFKRVLTEFSEDNLTPDRAAALTYYGVLSVFPALLAMVALVGLVGDPHTITKDLWTASGYVGAFMRASNVIYEVEEGRSFIKLRPLQTLVTLIIVVLLALAVVAVVLTGPIASKIGSAIGVSSSVVTVWNIAKWPVLLLVLTFIVALLYYSAPNARLRGLRSIVPGAAFAVVIWLVASAAFAFYVANFGSDNKTYGTFGAIISSTSARHRSSRSARGPRERHPGGQPRSAGWVDASTIRVASSSRGSVEALVTAASIAFTVAAADVWRACATASEMPSRPNGVPSMVGRSVIPSE